MLSEKQNVRIYQEKQKFDLTGPCADSAFVRFGVFMSVSARSLLTVGSI